MNKTVVINTYELLFHWWDFFHSSLVTLNSHDGARLQLSVEQLFKVMLHVSLCGLEQGVVLLLTSKNDKPLGFAVVFEDSRLFQPKTALVWVVFTNEKALTTTQQLIKGVKHWALQQNFTHLTAETDRISGGSVRWFKKMGFKRQHLGFIQKV